MQSWKIGWAASINQTLALATVYPIALRAYSATVPEQKMRDTDYDAVIVFLGVHKAGALMFLAKQGGTGKVKFRLRA